ncbi:MAG: glycerol-3-phosphate 1-O-acyltransferase PlsY [Legionella sp.]|nr:glycerol-3-phosphate 1-O-acyltransferase PlsY [Legionella sp.]
MIVFLAFVALGYLMGSISSAVIVSRLFSLPDPRLQGSKNPGATNMLRLAGKQYAALVMMADVLKGLIPVMLAILLANPMVASYTALAAVFGHMYPVFFEFKGGKGVATAIGGLIGLQVVLGVLVAITWLAVAKLTRYSSLASIVSICLAPLYSLMLFKHISTFPPLFFITLFILYKHNENIVRLFNGEENKINFTKSALDEIIPDPLPNTAHETTNGTEIPKQAKTPKAAIIKFDQDGKPIELKKTPPKQRNKATAGVKKPPTKPMVP